MQNRLLNYKAILLSTVIAMLISALWYGYFSEEWMNGNNLTMDVISQNTSPYPYLISFVSSFTGIWVLAWLINKLEISSALSGGLLALVLALAFHFLPLVTQNSFAMKSLALLLVDGGIIAVNLFIAGIILAAWKKYKDV